MDWQNIDWNHALPYIGPILIVALVARRLIKNAPRKVSLRGMLIFPVVALIGTGVTLAYSPPPPLFWIVGYVVALALGAGVGFLTTHHQEFSIDENGAITSRATPIGTMLIGGLFVVRYGLRMVFPQMNGAAPGGHPSADVLAWTDAGLIFACAMLIARAATTWFHAKPLIDAHKASGAAPAGGDSPHA